jgi:ketosteroid isomerase-like protein
MQNAAREQADASANDFDILQQLNRNYVKSVETSDVRWFEENLAEDFLNINADGALVDRVGFLAQIARPSTRLNLEARDVRIRIIGDCAIVNAQTTYKKADGQAERAGTPTSGRASADAGFAFPRNSPLAEVRCRANARWNCAISSQGDR